MANEKSKNNQNKKVSLFGYDPVETPEEIIDSDKNNERKDAFKNAYKNVMKIIPEFFLNSKRKKPTSTSGGSSFTQNIVVTPDNVKLETNKEIMQDEKQEEKERE